ncbi:MAG TPA: CoA transferase [Frankiaceae bacterium]|jgi:CoA:oxalate CoA-transferase|nr:CoA transferase [Frankiaceae bacterium]
MSGSGPLAGVLVVDLSRVLAGPFATMLMADLGARVIKVERPQRGDDSRTYGPFIDGDSLYFARVNRGKESIALDLRSSPDLELLHRMLARADVLVENFRPGVMDRLGLGYEALSARYPGLVYASISGFGQTGPWRLRPAYDSVVQGTSGLMSITGAPEGEPTKPGLPISDLSAGLYAFGAILAALRGRDSDAGLGRGSRVDIAMHDATVSLLEGAALAYLASGQAPPRIGNAHYAIAPFDTFRASDGPLVICAANDGLFAKLSATIERTDLVTNPLFVTNALRHDHREALKKEIEAALTARTAADWLDILGAAGVPCGPVSSIEEALTSEQAADRGLIIDVGGLPMPGNPMKLGGYPDLHPEPAPRLDEQGAKLRSEFGS